MRRTAWWGSQQSGVFCGTSLLCPGVEQGFATSALLISSFSSAALEFTQAGKSVEAKIYDTLQWQVTRSAWEPCHSVRLVPGWGAVTGAKAVASHLFLCLPGLDSAAWLLHPSHRRGGSLQGAGPHPGHGHQRAPRPPPHCVPGLAHPHPKRLRDRLGWKQTLVVGPCHLWEGRC